MRAIAIDAYGGPERLQLMDLPVPQIGPDDVLIRVQTAGVSPGDVKLGQGVYAQWSPLTFPAIMGSDFAGTVAQVGEHVTTVRVDTPVYGVAWAGGSYAEYMRVPANGEFVTRPAALSVEQAGALPATGMTALGAVDRAALTAGAVLLIVGGAGGIGSLAIQMAAQQGVHVIATGKAEDQAYLRSLGAAETVDYTQGDVAAAVRAAHPDGIDAVLDLVSDADALAHIAEVLRPGGRLLSTLVVVDPAAWAERGITAIYAGRPSGTEWLERLSRMVEAGALKVPVQERLPLEEAARAEELLEHGHVRGKVVLTVA